MALDDGVGVVRFREVGRWIFALFNCTHEARGVEEAIREQEVAGQAREVQVGAFERRVGSGIRWVDGLVQRAEAT